jgi:hypothetical protein
MADTEHANFERTPFHARAYYEPERSTAARENAVFIEKFSTLAQTAANFDRAGVRAASSCPEFRRTAPMARNGSVTWPELERAGRESNLEQECREGRGEAHHAQHEQDGYDSRQVG